MPTPEEQKPELTGENLDKDPKTGKFLLGHKGVGGRPKGSFSIKTKIIKKLEDNPEELEAVINYIIRNERALLFQMIDGRPAQDITSAGEAINPTPIYGNKSIQGHIGDEADIQPQEENTGG